MTYLQEIQEAKNLLNDPKSTYVQLFDKVCELERLYGEKKILIKMGFAEDIITLWKISSITNKIQFKLKHRIKKLALANKLINKKFKIQEQKPY